MAVYVVCHVELKVSRVPMSGASQIKCRLGMRGTRTKELGNEYMAGVGNSDPIIDRIHEAAHRVAGQDGSGVRRSF